jgi:hypothetical protein
LILAYLERYALVSHARAKATGLVRLVEGGRAKAPQNLRHTTRVRPESAGTVDDMG